MDNKDLDFDSANAETLIEILMDPVTPESVRLNIIGEILESSKNDTFFEMMFLEEMSLGRCPYCRHKNHWLVPEDELNVMNWVTHETDSRVAKQPTRKTCEVFQEACTKKKVTT